MSEVKIKGKSIEEINMMLENASAEQEEARQAFFDAQWESLKEEIAAQEQEIDLASEMAASLEWDQFVEDNNLTYEDVSRGW